MGIEDKLCNTIRWLYQQTRIRVGKQDCKIEKGVIQGGVLSPSLFLIAFDDIIKNLKRNELKAYAYADDLAIHGIGKEKLH